jgi:hypothetical protein
MPRITAAHLAPSLALALVYALGIVSVGCARPDSRARAQTATVTTLPQTKAPQRLMGTWAIELSPNEDRLLQIAKLALDEADRRPELAKMNPTDEERSLYEDIVTLSSTFDPRLEQIERRVKLAGTRIVITPESVDFDSGNAATGGSDQQSRYAVESEGPEQLVLRVLREGAEHELVTVQFVDDDTIAITLASQKESRRFVRRK